MIGVNPSADLYRPICRTVKTFNADKGIRQYANFLNKMSEFALTLSADASAAQLQLWRLSYSSYEHFYWGVNR